MSRRSLLVLAVVACGERGTPPAPAVAHDASLDAAPPPAIAAPHGSEIALVAATDDGRAALTADERGDLRFWPALDGTREPVVVHAHAPVDLALARARDGYLAAVLDAARGIELLHLAQDGGVRGRQLLAPDYVELAAAREALFARRADHVIVRLDRPRSLAPAPGEQLLGLAARGYAAVAAIADPERPGEIATVRALAFAGDLAWGSAAALPEPLAPPIALAPSGRRIAGVHARTGAGVIIELGAIPRVLASGTIGAEGDEHALGFLDDDRAVFRGGFVVSVPEVTVVADPWDRATATARVRLGRGPAIADRVSIAGIGTSLVLADGARTRFLGYREVGVGQLRVTGDQITLGVATRVLWLDERLRVRRARDISADALGGLAPSATQLLAATYSYVADNRGELVLTLRDVTTGASVTLGTYPQGSAVVYDPGTGVYAVSGHPREVARARLDLAARVATPLRPLKTRAYATVELLEPAVAQGVVAVAYTASTDITIETFVEDGTRDGPLLPATVATVKHATRVLGVDRSGALYALAPGRVVVHRGGREVTRIAVAGAALAGAVDRAGTQLAVHTDSEVILYDLDGTERWRAPAWSVNIATFTADGKTLLVNTQGGLMALDTTTGARQATGCGWNFGLADTEPQLAIFLAPVVCAEAP